MGGRQGWALVAIVVAAACFLAWRLPLPEALWGHDGPIHHANIHLLAEAIENGNWLPRWLPEVNGGLGGPNFRYYSFFSYYPAALLLRFGHLSDIEALGFTCRLYFILGFLGTAALAARLFGSGASLFAAILFVFSPYPLVLLEARLALPEYTALNLAPWVVLALERFVGTADPRSALPAAFGAALLLLTHNLAAILWLPLVFVFGAFGTRPLRESLVRSLCGIAAGVLLALFQFAPSLVELSWIDACRQLHDPKRFSAWTLPLSALFSNEPLAGFSSRLVPGPLLVAVISVSLVAAFLPLRLERNSPGHRARRTLRLVLGLALAALALTTAVSIPLADVFPPLTYIQFPWRFLGPFSLFAALAGSALAARLPFVWNVVATAALLVATWCFILPVYGASIAATPMLQAAADARDLVYTGDFENKYLPLGARLPPAPIRESVLVPAHARILSTEERYDSLRFAVETGAPAELIVRRYWFPGWHLRLDGKEIEAARDELNGEIAFTIPAGRHAVDLRRRTRTLSRLYGAISLLALLALSGRLICKRRKVALFLWIPCLLATAATAAWGILSPEGFRPPAPVQRAMLSDSIRPENIGQGWAVVHYPREGREETQPERGFAASLNLAPGGALRDGMAVWTAELEPNPSLEFALEFRGPVLVFVNGKPLNLKEGSEETAGGLRRTALPQETLSLSPSKPVSLTVAAGQIENGTYARLLCRNPRNGEPWRLVPPSLLRPAPNEGYRELFKDLAAPPAE